MPRYLYKCPYCGQERQIVHSMTDKQLVVCERCEAVGMHKVPQNVAVNWNGRKPSDGGVTPLVSDILADTPRRVDEFAQIKEEHNERELRGA